MGNKRIGASGFKRAVLFTLCTALALPAFSQAVDSQWWFDVELIAFKRELLPNHPEDFTKADFEFSNAPRFDLFTLELLKQSNPNFRLTNTLPRCDAPPPKNIRIEVFEVAPLLSQAQAFIEFNASTALEFEEPRLDIATAEFIENHLAKLKDNDELLKSLKANVACVLSPEYEVFTQVPQSFFADEPYVFDTHAILANESKYLASYAKQVFRQRDISPILYTAWRQPVVFGEDKAQFYKIYAGKRLSNEAKQSPQDALAALLHDIVHDTLTLLQEEDAVPLAGSSLDIDSASAFAEQTFNPGESNNKQNSKPSTLDVLKAMQSDLENSVDVIWSDEAEGKTTANEDVRDLFNKFELEGLFKVYLENVNRVPYLHIDAEFKHHRLDIDAQGNAKLLTYPSQQRRRIISKQIHYFDHPAYGIIVRLERYEVPSTESDEADVLE